MAEVLIRWVDKVPAADPLYQQNLRAGDVIVVCEDGWPWSYEESTGNPAWRLIKLPNVTVSLVNYLMDPAIDTVAQRLVGKRKHFLDKSIIPSNVRNQIENNRVFTSQISGATLLSWVQTRIES